MKINKTFQANLSLVILSSITSIFICLFLIPVSCKKDSDDHKDTNNTPTVTGLFTDANFRATHNSYSGNLYLIYDNGHRGSIEQQLDLGVRYLELDLLGKYGNHDFQLGHFELLTAIDYSHGNPSSDKLSDWIRVINDWSDANHGHAPILIAIETKNEFTAEEWGLFSQFIADSVHNLVKPPDFDYKTTKLTSVMGKIFVVSIPGNGALTTTDPFIFKAQGHISDPAQDTLGVFYTTHADNSYTADYIQTLRALRKSIRLAYFTKEYASLPAPNYPSCDDPYFGWYTNYCENNKVIPKFDFAETSWSPEMQNDKGAGVDCAVNNAGMVVEVHHSQNYSSHPGDVWYNTGKINGESIDWFTVSNDLRHYSSSANDPAVAINDNNQVVEVHSKYSIIPTNELYYRTGTLDNTTGIITWMVSKEFDEGIDPSVAINNDGYVVEVHRARTSNKLWYNVGKVQTDGTITWGSMGDYRNYDTGQFPAVALNGDQILEAHNSTTDYLWSRIGLLDADNKKINWKDSRGKSTYSYPFEADGSLHADVALNATSSAEIHKSSNNLWFRPGKLSNTVMAWGRCDKIATTYTESSIAMNSNVILVFFSDASDNLKYRIGTLKK
jgi:hypothetical protein